jgi:hypothetical protein
LHHGTPPPILPFSSFGGYKYWWINISQFGVLRSQGIADPLACYGTCITLALGISEPTLDGLLGPNLSPKVSFIISHDPYGFANGLVSLEQVGIFINI